YVEGQNRPTQSGRRETRVVTTACAAPRTSRGGSSRWRRRETPHAVVRRLVLPPPARVMGPCVRRRLGAAEVARASASAPGSSRHGQGFAKPPTPALP